MDQHQMDQRDPLNSPHYTAIHKAIVDAARRSGATGPDIIQCLSIYLILLLKRNRRDGVKSECEYGMVTVDVYSEPKTDFTQN